MQDIDRGFKEVARRAGRELARVAGIECDQWTPLVSEVQTVERFADRAFLARRGRERFVVYFEAYARWDRHAPWNVMTKAALLSERERLPTCPVLFVLRPRGYASLGGEFVLRVGDETTQTLCVRQVPLWEQEPQPWWENVPGLMTLYPLCRHGRAPGEAIERAAAAIRSRVPPGTQQADDAFLLTVFGGMITSRRFAEAIVGREILMASNVVKEMASAMVLDARRDAVLSALEVRFGSEAAARFRETTNAQESAHRLKELLRAAVSCTSPDEFAQALTAAPPARRRRRSRSK
jgi:hypothetical protein